jgi:cell division protein ZapA
MAALTIADELTEMGSRIKKLEQDLVAAQEAQATASNRDETVQAAVAAALANAAERIEGVTKKLNHGVGGNNVAQG